MVDVNIQVLRERAASYAECIEKIIAKYGKDYTVRSKNRIKYGGFLGFFEKDGVEITFVLTPPSANVRYSGGTGYAASNYAGRPYEEKSAPDTYAAPPEKMSRGSSVPDFEESKKQILAKSGMLQTVQLKEVLEEVRALRDDLSTAKNSTVSDEHPSIVKIAELLEANEFSSAYIKRITARLKKEFTMDSLEQFEEVQNTVVDWIGESVSVFIPQYIARPQVIVLVGPTGVGKTTTIAKMAGQLLGYNGVMPQMKEIRMITTDNVRIGAKEQLERYGEIMGIPVENPKNEDELQNILRLYSSGIEYILVDTPGYSPKDYENIARMRKFLNIKGIAVESYLAMSASTKFSDMCDIIRQYEIFGFSSVVITKFDETDHVGSVISALSERGKSVAYLATGQGVPRCLEQASVIRFLMQLSGFKIDRSRIEAKFITGSAVAEKK